MSQQNLTPAYAVGSGPPFPGIRPPMRPPGMGAPPAMRPPMVRPMMMRQPMRLPPPPAGMGQMGAGSGLGNTPGVSMSYDGSKASGGSQQHLGPSPAHHQQQL